MSNKKRNNRELKDLKAELKELKFEKEFCQVMINTLSQREETINSKLSKLYNDKETLRQEIESTSSALTYYKGKAKLEAKVTEYKETTKDLKNTITRRKKYEHQLESIENTIFTVKEAIEEKKGSREASKE